MLEAIGVEIEYMIVDARSLEVLPVCDRLLRAEAGDDTGDVEFEDITWSNEMVLHVVELKTSGPVRSLSGLDKAFGRHLQRISDLLAPMNGRLLPGAVHPWMDPHTQTRLWPHDNGEVYAAFNRIFDCRGHGWSNLQSVHVNLPFQGDEQFGRLHAAIRLVLPIIPAIAAGSPIVDGRFTGLLDYRLDAYRRNCARIPSVTGQVIPEPVFTIEEYHDRILKRIYRDLAPYDPEGILQHEWANARGAIARFERDTIEIRVIDAQECPAADLAIAAAIQATIRLLVAEKWSSWCEQQNWAIEPLAAILDATVREGEAAEIQDAAYLATLGCQGQPVMTAGEAWRHLIAAAEQAGDAEVAYYRDPLAIIQRHATLARRILKRTGEYPSSLALLNTWAPLGEGLRDKTMFIP